MVMSDWITVNVTVEENRSYFACPDCGRRIAYKSAYPTSFMGQVCKGCRRQWVTDGGAFA